MSRNMCFVPVRKNSKGISQRNIKKVGEKSLLCRVIDGVISSKISDCIFVNIKCNKIKKLLYNRFNGKINDYIMFFLKIPMIINDNYCFLLIIDLILEITEIFSRFLMLVRGHPEYILSKNIIK